MFPLARTGLTAASFSSNPILGKVAHATGRNWKHLLPSSTIAQNAKETNFTHSIAKLQSIHPRLLAYENTKNTSPSLNTGTASPPKQSASVLNRLTNAWRAAWTSTQQTAASDASHPIAMPNTSRKTYFNAESGYLGVAIDRPDLGDEATLLPPRLLNRGEYHITIVTPPEIKALAEKFDQANTVTIPGSPLYKGLGRTMDGDNAVYYMVVEWPEAQAYRKKLGLAPSDLHITIGFVKSDIHGVRKHQTLKDQTTDTL